MPIQYLDHIRSNKNPLSIWISPAPAELLDKIEDGEVAKKKTAETAEYRSFDFPV